MNRALLVHQGAIGDFVVACRLIELCDRAWGKHQWAYLGKPSHGRLARALNLIDAYEDFDRPGWHLLFTEHQPLPDPMGRFLQPFDLVLNVICGKNEICSRRLEQLSPGRVVHVDPKLPDDYPHHVLQFLAAQIFDGQGTTIPTTAFSVAPDILEPIRQSQNAGLTLFHPGASGRSKRWPLERFLAAMNEASRSGEKVGVLLGEVELEQFRADEIQALQSVGRPFFGWPLENLAGLLALSHRYIGNDNGISHLAAAVGANTTVIFTRQNAHQWRPIGPKVSARVETKG